MPPRNFYLATAGASWDKNKNIHAAQCKNKFAFARPCEHPVHQTVFYLKMTNGSKTFSKIYSKQSCARNYSDSWARHVTPKICSIHCSVVSVPCSHQLNSLTCPLMLPEVYSCNILSFKENKILSAQSGPTCPTLATTFDLLAASQIHSPRHRIRFV